MRPVNLFCSKPHYLDHLAPIWLALDPYERGRLIAGSAQTWCYANELGLPEVARSTSRLYPFGKATMTAEGYQPRVLVASIADYRASGRARCIWVEHGAGQYYIDDPIDGARPPTKAARRRVDLILAPGPDAADLFAEHCAGIPVVPVGCPKLDAMQPVRDKLQPIVAVTFHWDPHRCAPERRSAYAHWAAAIQELPAIADRHGWRLLATCHPKAAGHVLPALEHAGYTIAPLATILANADVLVADNTSAIFEAAALDVRPVLLDAPWYRRGVHHGLRFWTHADVGPRVGSGYADELAVAIACAAIPNDPTARTRVCERVYGGPADGLAAERAVHAMREHLP